jgi:hypothetical protein
LSQNRAAGPGADLIGRERRPKGDHHDQFQLRLASHACEAAAEILAFVWCASMLSFCVPIMALYFLA